jgi:tetratricopeptide (TPR) repeat protein
VITNQYTLPVQVQLHSIFPHAHHLASQVSAWAMLPGGDRMPLLLIRDWDFNWQDVYRYVTPVTLPAGTTLHMRYVYDNSGRRQHHSGPPRRVTYGPNSSDEMGDLWLQVVTSDGSARSRLVADFERKLLPETIAGLEMMSRNNPADSGLHDELGLLLLERHDLARAAEHFADSLRLNPGVAAGHANIASALIPQNRLTEARSHLAEALRLDPAHAGAHFNLGLISHLEGRLADAATQYRTALRFRDSYAEAHHMLATALDTMGSSGEAVREYRRAIDARPDWPIPLIQLAWMLATAARSSPSEVEEARVLAEHAIEVSETPSAGALDAMAAALARLGQFEQAVRAASEASAIAGRAGDARLARLIGERLQRYRRHEQFLLP